jgi:hypothetical protein
MEFCECTTSRFSEQSRPDWLLVSSREIAENAKEEWLDEHRINNGANAGEYRETMSKENGMDPRVRMSKSDIDQDRGEGREYDELYVVEHVEIVVLGGVSC